MTTKVDVYLNEERLGKIRQIKAEEHRGSLSNTIDALLAEALKAREEKQKRKS